jgi:hypothetical protein
MKVARLDKKEREGKKTQQMEKSERNRIRIECEKQNLEYGEWACGNIKGDRSGER